MKKGILLTVFGVVVVSFIGCAGAPTWKSFVRNHAIKVEETPEKVESLTDDKKVIKSPDGDSQAILVETKEGIKMIFQ